jgi:Domain of Unknown Function (DUF1080)
MTKKSVLNFLPLAVALTLPTLFTASCTSGGDKAASSTDSASLKEKDGFVNLFDGKTFTGWQGDTAYWRIDNGEFIGEEHPDKMLKNNTFLIWRGGTPGDFEFKAEYRISGGGNSGVQYRSEELKDIPLALKGYQADIDGANQYTGQNYEERGRGFLAMRGQKVNLEPNVKPIITDSLGNADSLKTHIKDSTQWNEVHIIAKGNHMQHYINGTLMSDAIDNDTTARKMTGVIGLQMHVMPYMKVEYRNIRLKQD